MSSESDTRVAEATAFAHQALTIGGRGGWIDLLEHDSDAAYGVVVYDGHQYDATVSVFLTPVEGE